MQVETIDIIDQRMLDVPILLKSDGRIRYIKEYLEEMNMHRQNIQKIKSGQISFTKEQILRVCKSYRINANWLLGLEKNPYRR